MAQNGIHHVTAIAGPARRNLDFYTRTLGLRLVKRTVNFDDPGTHHFYYGDETGRPGTILTFFPWEQAAPGRAGVGQAQETAFRVPEGAVGFWAHRLVEHGVRHEAPAKRFGETVLAFQDPDGTRLALVGVRGAEGEAGWVGEGSDMLALEFAILFSAVWPAVVDDLMGHLLTRDDLLRRRATGQDFRSLAATPS